MKTFDVLDPKTDITSSRIIEASAGTGKTFTAQQLYVRLLLERDPPAEVSQILVVTFTKAATRELRMRIREALTKAGDKLKGALASFDEAKIFTLHGFCHDALRSAPIEADLPPFQEEEGDLAPQEKLRIVRDYFQTGLNRFSPGQLHVILRWAFGDPDKLAQAILREVERGGRLVAPPFFEEIFAEVRWDRVYPAQTLLEVARKYKGLASRGGELKLEVVENIESFARDLGGAASREVFDRWIREGNVFLEKVVRGELKAKQERGAIEGEFEELARLLSGAKNPLNILAQMAARVKELIDTRLAVTERLTFDRMLEAMERATRSPSFCAKIQGSYEVAIVDEFQDTDPLQWKILQRLFGGKTLFLVGDPKQSIYAFRKADIYCYLDALDALGEQARCGLTTNYRARPGLVRALNALFSPSIVSDPIPLPGRKETIACLPVQAGREDDHPLSEKGAIQFFVGSGEAQFFPFIGREIHQLRLQYKLPYSHFAVLIHDRYQAERLSTHLKAWGIPSVSVSGSAPADFPLFWPLYHVVCAALQPEDQVAIRTALASPLIDLSSDRWDGEAYLKIQHLHIVLKERGFFPFFETFMNTQWDDRSPAEKLIEEGPLLYELAQKIAEAEEQDLIRLFHQMAEGRDERFVLRRPREQNAVSVLTTFASKGLEFGVVFALALATRKRERLRSLIPYRRGGETFLSGEGGTEEERMKMAEEGDAEKMRLFYVALTRAKDRVYVPVALDSGKEVRLGMASPVELYLAKLQPADDSLYKALPIANVKRLDKLREAGMAIREIEEGIIPVKDETDPPSPVPQKLGSPPVSNPRRLQSFSGLSEGTHNTTPVTGDEPFQSLVAGVETGQLVHELLEKIDPQTPAEAVPLKVKAIARGRLEGWEAVLSEMVIAAFNRPLADFCLREVPPSRMLRETDLLYETAGGCLDGHPLVPGLVTGVLDLFFEHGGATYLLDWKSNRLPSYGEESLRQEMEASDYLFQAKLYAEAVNRYLRRLGAPPLAGCFYVFLRGFAAGEGGVLFLEPEELRWT